MELGRTRAPVLSQNSAGCKSWDIWSARGNAGGEFAIGMPSHDEFKYRELFAQVPRGVRTISRNRSADQYRTALLLSVLGDVRFVGEALPDTRMLGPRLPRLRPRRDSNS